MTHPSLSLRGTFLFLSLRAPIQSGRSNLDVPPLSLRGARFLAYASEQAPQSRWGFPPVVARHDRREAISGTIGVVSKQYYVYMMTNNRNTVLYVGVTNDLIRRVYEHKEKLADGFTRKYNITKLVYYEVFEDIENAILREKQIKAGSRQKKVQLINSINREWHELYNEL